MPRFNRYLAVTASTLVLLSVPFLGNLAFLYRSDEMLPLNEAVAIQLKQSVLYGPAFLGSVWAYKVVLMAPLKPDVVVIGSSRVSTLRGDVFKTSFLNAGAAMHSLPETRLFIEALFKVHVPKVIVLAPDPYWFNPSFEEPRNFPEHLYESSQLTRYKLLSPFEWLALGKVSFSNYVKIILGSKCIDNASTGCFNMGLYAILTESGFRQDGSFTYGERISGQKPDDVKFRKSFHGLEVHQEYFLAAPHVDLAKVNAFLEQVQWCLEKGSRPIIILPTTAFAIQERLQADPDHFGYINELDHLLRDFSEKNHIEYYDFRDIRSFGSNACECLDGTHLGEVGFCRLLRQIIRIRPGSSLAAFLDLSKLDQIITSFGGHARYVGGEPRTHFQEVDFLDLGCPK